MQLNFCSSYSFIIRMNFSLRPFSLSLSLESSPRSNNFPIALYILFFENISPFEVYRCRTWSSNRIFGQEEANYILSFESYALAPTRVYVRVKYTPVGVTTREHNELINLISFHRPSGNRSRWPEKNTLCLTVVVVVSRSPEFLPEYFCTRCP